MWLFLVLGALCIALRVVELRRAGSIGVRQIERRGSSFAMEKSPRPPGLASQGSPASRSSVKTSTEPKQAENIANKGGVTPHIKENESLNHEKKSVHGVKIAVLIPATLGNDPKMAYGKTAKRIPAVNISVPSIIQTHSSSYSYEVFVGVDASDAAMLTYKAVLEGFSTPKVLVIVVPVPASRGGTFVNVVNYIAGQALANGAEYMVRINDDTAIKTKGWSEVTVAMLRSLDPPNVGVVGPVCRQGNTQILTHDMVHRSHFETLGWYYPPQFRNWWADDWITRTYKQFIPTRMFVVKSWEVVHTMGLGTRYRVNHRDATLLKPLMKAAQTRLRKAHNMSSLVGYGSRAISFVLYGNSSSHDSYARKNTQLAKQLYHGWTLNFYHDGYLSQSLLADLGAEEHVILHDMSQTNISHLPDRSVWRFLIAQDDAVDRFIVRDIESPLLQRDKEAVESWIRSQKVFHFMRDHPSHGDLSHPVLPGLWGAMSRAARDLPAMVYSSRYSTTELLGHIWTLAKRSTMLQHDAFTCRDYVGAQPFPVKRHSGEYVGMPFEGVGATTNGLSNLNKSEECE